MWLRELIQNSIDAVIEFLKNTPNDIPQDIYVRKLDLDNLVYINDDVTKPKLKNKISILNVGGMSQDELNTRIHIGSSGKIQSLEGNFGIGAKSSVLGFSQLLFITYKDGEAYCAGLRKKMINSVDFVVEVFTEENGFPSFNCTDWVIENAEYRGYNLKNGFTEVILLGESPEQNTYVNTFGKDKTLDTNHIRKELGKRYFRLPANVNIKMHQNVTGSDKAKATSDWKTFTPYPVAFDKTIAKNPKTEARYECVTTSDNYKIHYYYDPAKGGEFGDADRPITTAILDTYGWASTFSGLVFKDEIYDHCGIASEPNFSSWQATAPYIGIEGDFKYFRVFVEVPPILQPDKYRTFIRKNGEEFKFNSKENLNMIYSNRPQWFIDLCEKTQLKTNVSLKDKLKELFDQYKGLNMSFEGTPGNHGTSTNPFRPKNPRPTPPNPNPTPRPSTGGGGGINLPEMIEATSQQIKDFNLKNHFAHVQSTDKGDKVIYNPDYKKIDAVTSVLQKNENEQVWIKPEVTETFVLQTGLWVVINRSNLQKRGADGFDDFTKSTSSEFIDTYLDTMLVTLQSGIDSVVTSIRNKKTKQELIQAA